MLGRTNTGGGGGGLNFAVKAYASESTMPATAKENTIAIITAETMTSWAFDAVAPVDPAEGMVWMEYGDASAVAFNVAKKNSVMIYPLSAKQYIGGEWVDVDAKSWQGGEWVDWWIPGTLFDSGRDDEAVTGGWTSYAESVGSGYSGQSADVSIEEDRMRITFRIGSSAYKSTFISTVNTIDMSGYNSAHFEFVGASGSGWAKLSVSGVASNQVNISDLDDVGSLDVDISGLSADTKKSCKVGLFLWTNTKSQTITVDISLARLI